jgi:hypothetical protein
MFASVASEPRRRTIYRGNDGIYSSFQPLGCSVSMFSPSAKWRTMHYSQSDICCLDHSELLHFQALEPRLGRTDATVASHLRSASYTTMRNKIQIT